MPEDPRLINGGVRLNLGRACVCKLYVQLLLRLPGKREVRTVEAWMGIGI